MTKKTSILCPLLATGKLLITSLQFKSCSRTFNLMNWSPCIMMTKILEKFHIKYQKSKFGSIVTLFTGLNEVVAKVIFSVACVKNSFHRVVSHFGLGVSHFGPGGSPILVQGVSIFCLGVVSRPTAKGEIQGDLVQAHSQGGSSGDQKQTPPKIRSMSGRYASYWNAFSSSLFKSSLRKKVRTPHVLR